VGRGGRPGLGRIAEGFTADIVLLDANPLEDIRNTQRIWRVIKGGCGGVAAGGHE
jgi:imidazolonepropionase-like amidohydrolase